MSETNEYSEDRNGRNSSPRRNEKREQHLERDDHLERHRGGGAEHGSVEDDSMKSGNTLYITNLSAEVSQDELRKEVEVFGFVEECRIIVNPVTKESRGFAFVTFEDPPDANTAMANLNGRDLNGKSIRVELAKRSKPHDPTPGRYKGPKRASIKYDQRGRLKPGYVPYWEIGPKGSYGQEEVYPESQGSRRSRRSPRRDSRDGGRNEAHGSYGMDDRYRMRHPYEPYPHERGGYERYDGPPPSYMYPPEFYGVPPPAAEHMEYYRRMMAPTGGMAPPYSRDYHHRRNRSFSNGGSRGGRNRRISGSPPSFPGAARGRRSSRSRSPKRRNSQSRRKD